MTTKLNLDSLVIEVTRRCNMACDHCLRGDAENLDIKMVDVAHVLNQFSSVGNITFTGGEPSLNVRAIDETLRLCKKFNIEVNSFYIATNGVDIPESFVMTCLRWYSYCDDNEATAVQVSNDYFHACEESYDTTLLDGLSFFSRKYTGEAEYYDGIAEGRNDNNSNARVPNANDTIIIEDGRMQEGTLYLNCEGNVILGCDWSYESQREREELLLCKADDDIVAVLLERFGEE